VDPTSPRRTAVIALLSDDARAIGRAQQAPDGYVLAHAASDIVRHCDLAATVPRADEVRVVVTPGRRADAWNVDVVARDRPGLLASCSGVLADHRLDVIQAVAVTWEDGTALEAFVVRSDACPDAILLERSMALGRRLVTPAVTDADVTFPARRPDSPYSPCEIRAADRPGLLHCLAVAIAAAGVDVHAAGVTTRDGVALDRFDLTDGNGRPLSPFLECAIRRCVLNGVPPRP
jgi:[protein-PII] uridylyltransferase